MTKKLIDSTALIFFSASLELSIKVNDNWKIVSVHEYLCYAFYQKLKNFINVKNLKKW